MQGRGIVGVVFKDAFEMIERAYPATRTRLGQAQLPTHGSSITGRVQQSRKPADCFVESILPDQHLCESQACVPVIRFNTDYLKVVALGQVETSLLMKRGREGKKTIDGHN